jgi:hypothetical protein
MTPQALGVPLSDAAIPFPLTVATARAGLGDGDQGADPNKLVTAAAGWAWSAGNTAAPQPQASAALRQSAGVTPIQVGVADHQLARRHRHPARLALPPPARSPGAPRREARRIAPGGMAADRVSRGREGANQILALDLAGKYRVCSACRCCQIALAHRTRLSGTQAGGRARPFRRPRMARLPPPRHDVHRNLRLLGLRARDDSP